MIGFAPPPNTVGAKFPPTLREETPVIAKELKRVLGKETGRLEVVPWWMGPTTIERARAMSAQIEGSLCSFAEANREFREAFRRLGFAGHRD